MKEKGTHYQKAQFGKLVVGFEKVWDPTKVPHKVVDGVFQDKPSPQSLWKAFLLDAFKNPDTRGIIAEHFSEKEVLCIAVLSCCTRVVGELDSIGEPEAIKNKIEDIYTILESDEVNAVALMNPLSQLSSLLEKLPKLPLEEEEEENSLKGTVDDCSQFLNSRALKLMGNQTQND